MPFYSHRFETVASLRLCLLFIDVNLFVIYDVFLKMAVSGANLQNVFMLITLEPLLARNPFLVLHVRRDHLVSDALRELTIYSDVDLKKPLKVRGL